MSRSLRERIRTRPPSTKTRARTPSHLSSKDHPGPLGQRPGRWPAWARGSPGGASTRAARGPSDGSSSCDRRRCGRARSGPGPGCRPGRPSPRGRSRSRTHRCRGPRSTRRRRRTRRPGSCLRTTRTRAGGPRCGRPGGSAPGSSGSPLGRAHETSTPSRSSRKSQCNARAWCSWMTKTGPARRARRRALPAAAGWWDGFGRPADPPLGPVGVERRRLTPTGGRRTTRSTEPPDLWSACAHRRRPRRRCIRSAVGPRPVRSRRRDPAAVGPTVGPGTPRAW